MTAQTVVVSGASGLVGTALCEALRLHNRRVLRLVRDPKGAGAEDGVYWNPRAGEIDTRKLERIDAVVHLAGESIVGRWTDEKKRRIRESRVLGTRLLARTFAEVDRKPAVFVSCSAIGYYGDRGDEVLTEDSSKGSGFLSDVCEAWEAETEPVAEAGVRVVHPRVGIVLSEQGGMLSKMVPPFKLGLGGRVGDGQQYMSWIRRVDLVNSIRFAIATTDLTGPYNACAPDPVRNEVFTKALGEVLHRPTMIPIPAFAAKLALGSEMTDELLLVSQRAQPTVLQEAGFRFKYPTIGGALETLSF